MFICERCGVDCSDDCFIVPSGKLLCPACGMLKDNVDLRSEEAMKKAKTVGEKVEAWMTTNGIV
jgi:late competence protein required for DNA uptake (superfamily II DNA/RNA helicase)